ncbi:inosine/xanthosine triphosphatase [Roseivirga sp. UBA1976]|uniref:inosine/xanthosine triphosphatase n=1 Tax=Roseivirga sp. UBA1976 TaxID=1947386 RepID=UPI00257A0A17|nr:MULTISPECIES: inosine/xanthosine triphosphatase [Bacteroidota]MEC7755245.1 inosine/xanthosine triphosphatase [Bacteroidota bacterium]|tara:strand:- start:41666 stop:42199 length:534 start_codon:yes stop_codon:yes gene_type:complete
MKEIKVVVASKNPVKINCTAAAFKKVFPESRILVEGISVPSGVADQPMTDKETLQGAQNRAENAGRLVPEAHYWVGIEGGIDEVHQSMEAFAWVYIVSSTRRGKARTASFDLPPQIQQLIHKGIELGVADDMVFKRSNSKQKNGAVGILTKDLINRAEYYEPAVVLALIPFVNQDLY